MNQLLHISVSLPLNWPQHCHKLLQVASMIIQTLRGCIWSPIILILFTPIIFSVEGTGVLFGAKINTTCRTRQQKTSSSYRDIVTVWKSDHHHHKSVPVYLDVWVAPYSMAPPGPPPPAWWWQRQTRPQVVCPSSWVSHPVEIPEPSIAGLRDGRSLYNLLILLVTCYCALLPILN